MVDSSNSSKVNAAADLRRMMVDALRLLDEYDLSLIAGCHLQAAIDELDAECERRTTNVSKAAGNDS